MKMKRLTLLLTATLTCLVVFAQTDTSKKDFYDLSLRDLMNMKVTITTTNEQTLRESPGIVTLITSDEIRNSGAVDLMDVLRNVPGLDFAQDVDNVVSIGIRGNWAQEGKVLLLFDGQEMQETSYQNLQFGMHYPIENIDRIEIIRGPGSAIYGGNAELAVINIVTFRGKNINGGSASSVYSNLSHSLSERNLSLVLGKQFRNGLDFSIQCKTADGIQSDKTIGGDGTPVNFMDSSWSHNLFLNVGIEYRNISFRYIYDDYVQRATYRQCDWLFRYHLVGLKYDWRLRENLKITPQLNFKTNIPWAYVNNNDTSHYLNTLNSRYTGKISVNYDPLRNVNIVAGVESFMDNAWYNVPESHEVFSHTNKNTVTYYNGALFSQMLVKSKFAYVTVGARFDRHQQYGSVFVPRFSITKKFDRLHFKFLFSDAFRAPSIINMNLNNTIRPEKTRVMEFETGYEISKNFMLTMNMYDISILDPILYKQDSVTEEYFNFDRTGTKGIEVETKYKRSWGYLNAGYSFYAPDRNQVPLYTVDGRSDLLVAFAAHKLSLHSSIRMNKHFYADLTFTGYSDRYGYDINDQLIHYSPTALAGVFLEYKDDRFTLGLGLKNILNQDNSYIQAYRSGYDPIPGKGREIFTHLTCKF